MCEIAGTSSNRVFTRESRLGRRQKTWPRASHCRRGRRCNCGGCNGRAIARIGAVDILINNASGWLADTFTAETRDRYGRLLRQVSAETFERQFSVDARGAAAMIAEFARRHAERCATWGRILSLTSGGPSGFPGEVSYGAAKAAVNGGEIMYRRGGVER